MLQPVFENYIQSISSKFSHQETSEMGYRSDFEILLKGIFASLNVKRIGHDERTKQGNKPDFVVYKFDVPILYIEAKDIGVSLDKIEKSDQMSRYFGYANLVLTDYVEFRFYRNGLKYEEPIKIAEYDMRSRTVSAIPENFNHLEKTLIDFTQKYKMPIKSGKHLAKIMGGKAQRIRDNVKQFLSLESEKNVEILRVFETFKKLLVHDLNHDSFADMYAQTLVYGLFVARFHDTTPENFTRQEARDLVPASNPLLRHFFDHIVGTNFDKRLEYIVNELCEVFSHADVQELMKEYYKKDLWGETHSEPDPVIHFYEDFLKEYDSELRKKLGAFYTPLPVVKFIVRAVDQILEKDFGLLQGLADSSKINGLHRVQILDPAVGTGTFLTEILDNIHSRFENQKGRWGSYVYHDLLPRLHGFELMMAPYTIAHLKMSMKLKEMGFAHFNSARLGIYLTNSLEESISQEDLFSSFGLAESIAEESKEASKIKNEKPIMIVIGNPPYSGESSNNFDYANKLINKYKIEPGGKLKLKEKNPKWLNDDYVKFIALAENLIVTNNEGIVGMITAHGYIDNPTFRGMRWHLRNTFDKIYILDLHGNGYKTAPKGQRDENVFDILQGVSIILGIKKSDTKEKKLAQIYKADFYGLRKEKFEKLNNSNIGNIDWTMLPENSDLWVLEGPGKLEYQQGFSVAELFELNSVGIATAKDAILINSSRTDLLKNVEEYFKIEPEERFVEKITYRPFDDRYIYYDASKVERSREKIMKHFLMKENLGFVFTRFQFKKQNPYAFCYVVNSIIDINSMQSPGTINIAPLYIYSDEDEKTSNLKKEIVDQIEKIVGKIAPEDVFDYIYAVLHSPSYREKFKEFLKIDFPRVPFPKDKKSFQEFVTLGTELRKLHLLESPKVNQFITTFPVSGSDTVEKVSFFDGKVFINNDQFFGQVPEIAWNFWIGGYQPAQKWLKDRKGRVLTNEDLEHYQKIIVVLFETDRLMKETDEIYKKIEEERKEIEK